MLHTHLRYYGLIRLPAQLPSFSLPYRKALCSCVQVVYWLAWRSAGSPKFRSFLSVHVAAHTPEASSAFSSAFFSHGASLCARHDDAGFVHQIGTRPPQLIFTRLPVRSLALRPGHSRSTLAGYIVEPLSAIDCAGSSLRGFRVLPRSGRWRRAPPRRTRRDKEQLCLALT